MITSEQNQQYTALREQAGWADASGRVRIEVSGNDRVTFLNGFCTNDVKRLAPGQGCEAFVTNVKGKTVGHLLLFCEIDRIVLETAMAQAATLINHLDRYVIREDVVFENVSDARARVLVGGENVTDIIRQLTGANADSYLDHCACNVAGVESVLHRVDMLGSPTYLLAFSSDEFENVTAALDRAGVMPCSEPVVEMARLENGFPLFGTDINDDNLPQEVGRDELAISFTKGCYLGQETVARLDALGHVNRLLVGVKFSGDQLPPAGSELFVDEQPAGRITSVAWSPALSAPLALAYVRHQWTAPGTSLTTDQAKGEVISLPAHE